MTRRVRFVALSLLVAALFVPFGLSASPRLRVFQGEKTAPTIGIFDTILHELRRIWEKTGSALDPFGGNTVPPPPTQPPAHSSVTQTNETGSALDPFGGK